MLKIIENNSTIETGSKGGNSGESKTNESGPRLWIEGLRKFLDNRRVIIQNEENTKIINNKTIIDYALKHSNE